MQKTKDQTKNTLVFAISGLVPMKLGETGPTKIFTHIVVFMILFLDIVSIFYESLMDNLEVH